MKTARSLRWPILGVLVVTAVLAVLLTSCGGAAKPGVRYHCPMHPTFVSDKPGDCPICGMRLVPIGEKLAPTTVPRYVCPMHPEVTSDKPGRCPECGMELVPVGSTGSFPMQHATYRCPMHPDFVTDDPNAHCPICGMKVVETGISRASGPLAESKGATVAAATRTSVPGPPAPLERRRILYYRNPMDPSVTSPVPMKDSMGMDYLPVYADEAAHPAASTVPGLATIQLTEEGIRLAGVQTAPAVEGRLARTIRTVGTVTADEARIRHFHTRVTGWVTKLGVDFTGEYVKKGQPVLSIYSPELLASQEEYLRARETAARFATSDLPEVRKGGEDLLAAARRRLRLFEVPESFIDELDRTGRPERDVTLLADASGYVTSKGVFQGQQVDPSMMDLYTITDLSHVWIDAFFYESEAGLLRLGEEATLTLPYDPSVRLTGRIAYIYPTVNPDTRTVKVRFDFANPALTLKPAMFVNVELATAGADGVVVPDSAIIYTGERQIAFVSLGNGRFEPRQVRVGIDSDGKALVLSGVAAGEQVVVKANFLLDSESQLRAALAGAMPPSATPTTGGAKP
jgi:RND family efflux transporter MFP subunit